MTSFSVCKQFAKNSDAVRAAVKVTILTVNSRSRSLCPMGQIPSIHRSYSSLTKPSVVSYNHFTDCVNQNIDIILKCQICRGHYVVSATRGLLF